MSKGDGKTAGLLTRKYHMYCTSGSDKLQKQEGDSGRSCSASERVLPVTRPMQTRPKTVSFKRIRLRVLSPL